MLQLNSRKGESVAINGDSPKSNSISEEPNARRNQEHRSMISEGKASQIRGLFRRAISVNKYHSASWIAWAKFEQHNGNPDVARRLLTEGINHFPHSKNIAWFHTALGNLAWHRGDVTTARACYSRALDTSPPQRSLSILLSTPRWKYDLALAWAQRQGSCLKEQSRCSHGKRGLGPHILTLRGAKSDFLQ